MLSTLVLNVTYKCPIECDYCGLSCNPRRTERMSVSEMLDVVDYATTLGTIQHVTLTGGEPLLYPQDVGVILARTRELGWSSRIVTNAFWAKSRDVALRRLAKAQAAGLTEMNLSVDDMHQAHIPLANIKNAHDACAELGVRVLMAHRAFADSQVTVARLEELFGQELFSLDDERARVCSEGGKSDVPASHVYSTSSFIPAGPKGYEIPADKLCADPYSYRFRCNSILKDLIVSPGKQIDLCCGVTNHRIPELKFAYDRAESIDQVLIEINKDLIANWLVLEGPCGISEYVQQKCPELKFDKPYVNNCHLCRDVLTHPAAREAIRNVDSGKLLELYFLRQIYDSKRTDSRFTSKMFQLPNLAPVRAELRGRAAAGLPAEG